MKLSKKTIEVLKNFAIINQSLLILPGKQLKTMTGQKNLVAVATVDDEFPAEAPIYDLNQFLATISLFENPEFEFGEKTVKIYDDKASAEYLYSDREAIASYTDKTPTLPSVDVTVQLDDKAIAAASKAAAVMGLPNVALIGEDGDIELSAIDSNNNSTHTWSQVVGSADDNFKMVYRLELLKFLPRTYKVEVSKKMITKFEAEDVTYFLAPETGSKFG